MIREVTMYRAECDHDGCEASPQDGSDYYAWAQPEGAEQDIEDAWDWYTVGGVLLCDEHAPVCAAGECSVRLHDDEFGAFCEDHAAPERPTGDEASPWIPPVGLLS